MASKESLSRLREVISENLRVQRGGSPVQYISVGTALQDAKSKQNHAIFARRGCGKTLLLHDSARHLSSDGKAIYLNCEDFKRHSFPNVLIEILSSIFRELDRNLSGWFGKKARSKKIIQDIISKLGELQRSADRHDEEIRRKSVAGENATTETGIDVGEQYKLYISGGNIFGIGGRIDANIGSTTQGIASTSGTVQANSSVTISSGSTTVATFTMPPYSYTNGTIMVSVPGMKSGTSYTLNLGNSSQTVTASTSVSSGMGGGGMPGGRPGGW